jgi:hypothetical protein
VWHLGDTLLLILAAVVLAEGLRPAIWALQRRGVPFGIATGLVYLALAGGLVLRMLGRVTSTAGDGGRTGAEGGVDTLERAITAPQAGQGIRQTASWPVLRDAAANALWG